MWLLEASTSVATMQAQQVNMQPSLCFVTEVIIHIINIKMISNIHKYYFFVIITMFPFLGLTVTLSRDSASGDYALEAGALVLADQGMKKRWNTDM